MEASGSIHRWLLTHDQNLLVIGQSNLLSLQKVVPFIFRHEAVSRSLGALILVHHVLDVLSAHDLVHLINTLLIWEFSISFGEYVFSLFETYVALAISECARVE